MTLNWPAGRKRTPYPKRAQFKKDLTLAAATSDLTKELNLLRARDLVIETDNRISLSGDPYSRSQKSDKGVVVRFTLPTGKQIVMCCDAWDQQAHNLRAIAYTIEAKRATERWGCATQEEEYAGYAALPASVAVATVRPLHEVLGISSSADSGLYRVAFREWAKKNHPDVGGDSDTFVRVKSQYEAAFPTVTP